MKTANLSQYAGSGTAVVFGLSPGEWQVLGIVVGIAVGVAGFAVNLFFKMQHYRLAREAREFKPGLTD
jgi:hypothetical protein